jgi:hypothetical protein
VETNIRGWELTRASREGREIACIHGRCQVATEDNVTAKENHNSCGIEELGGREGSTSIEDGRTRSVGAPARKGVVGRGDRHSENEQ